VNKPGNTSNSATIGSYATTLLDKDPDRINNIEIAIDEINGYTLQPGEVFSFNAIVGKRKAEKGYEKAKIIVNGKSKEGLGGGICQLSSTLYNAVRKADLEILERHSHSKPVPYVLKGQDAAVNYGTEDFKFRNSNDYPITIYVKLAGGKVYASIQS
jgi:vancomycin resistance protein YoaR